MIRGFATLLFFQLAGEVLSRLLGLPVPGPVVGLVLLLVGLELGWPGGEGLEQVAGGLLGNLSLLFVPAGVGVMLHAPRLAAEWPAILAALLVSTVATLAVTGWVTERLSRGTARGEGA
jgi:holin-like protein